MSYIPFGRENKLQSYLYDNAVKKELQGKINSAVDDINSSIAQINTQITNINNEIANINTEISNTNNKFPVRVITTETKSAPVTTYQYISYQISGVNIGDVINLKCFATNNAVGNLYVRFGVDTYYTYPVDSNNYVFIMACVVKAIGTTNTIFLAQSGSYANVNTTGAITPNILVTLTAGSVVYGEIEYIKNI